MARAASGAPLLRASHSRKHRLSRLSIAGLMATTVLAAAPVAHARITQIQILTRGTAFGGYSFAGVGQYEFITGIATSEVDPTNPQNALISDNQLAPKNARGHVVYQHSFYILQPLDPSKGNHKMMYEPPNRGGKTYQLLNNTPTGTNDPAALTDSAVLDDSFLWTRGYTTGREPQDCFRRNVAVDWGRRWPQHELSLVADQAHQPQPPGTALS